MGEREEERDDGDRMMEKERDARSYRSEPRGLEIGFLAASRSYRRVKRDILIISNFLLNYALLTNIIIQQQ